MSVLILDPVLEQRIRSEREEQNRYDEVWDGVLVMAPLPNNEHQFIVMEICYAFRDAVNLNAGDRVFPGVNVSDRDADWLTNYREPDVAVYLATNPAKNCGTHWVGGPDLAVEIVSPGEDPHAKLHFYATVNTRELLIVDRNPHCLELYQLHGGKLLLVGRADLNNSVVLASGVLPLTFQLKTSTASTPRATILLTHSDNTQTWTA
jgi:Uma2 family endonuclease